MVVPASEYTELELTGTLRALPAWWSLLTDGFDVPRDEFDALAPLPDRERVDRALALFSRVGRTLPFPRGLRGTVAGLFRSGGGVPKLPVDAVEIDSRGVVGDRQRSRRHHGRPWQALCLWSGEVVDAFAAAGHPITPGAAGENISLRGVDWSLVRVGMRVALGDAVVVELAPWSLPCAKNNQWFEDRDSTHMHHERGPVSRIYASVLQGGALKLGDPVILEP